MPGFIFFFVFSKYEGGKKRFLICFIFWVASSLTTHKHLRKSLWKVGPVWMRFLITKLIRITRSLFATENIGPLLMIFKFLSSKKGFWQFVPCLEVLLFCLVSSKGVEPRGWGRSQVAWLNRCVLPKSYSRWDTQKENSSFQEVGTRTEHTLLYVYFGKGRTELGLPGPQMSGMMNTYIHKRTRFLRRDLCLEGLTQR